MNKKHWVFLNAPPLSGKDTLATLLLKKYPQAKHLKLSQPLKTGLRAFFDLTDSQYHWCETPENKSKPAAWLNGLSWRQAQIDLAEILVRPVWGRDTFVQIAINKSINVKEPIIIVSDLGFIFEKDWFLYWNWFLSLTIISIEREGRTYNNDSREHVCFTEEDMKYGGAISNIFVKNNNSPEDMLNQLQGKLPFDY